MEKEELIFIFDDNARLILQYQRIQYDGVNEWEQKFYEAAQPQNRADYPF